MWSIASCANLAHAAHVRPVPTVLTTCITLSIGTVVLNLQPLKWRWVHWAAAEPRVFWVPPRVESLYLAPGELAWGLTFAMLPLGLLLAVARWPARRLVEAGLIGLASLAIVDGWLAPVALHARQQAFYERIGTERPIPPYVFPTTGQLFDLMRDPDRQVAESSIRTLRSRVQVLTAAMGLLLLGIAIGRSRLQRNLGAGVQVVIFWWAFGWISCRMLVYWSAYFIRATDLPAALGSWLPTATLLTTGLIALLAAVGRLDDGKSPAIQ